jgi:hypothetical protein
MSIPMARKKPITTVASRGPRLNMNQVSHFANRRRCPGQLFRSSRRAPPSASGSPGVDQEFGEGPRLGVAPIGADAVGPLEVGEHQDVKQLNAGSRPEGVQALVQSAFDVL